MEGYVFDDEGLIDEEGNIDYKSRPTNHIILLAATQEGMKNLYKLVSFFSSGLFLQKPRLPKSVINKYRDRLIIGSACEAGNCTRHFIIRGRKQRSERSPVSMITLRYSR